MMDIFVDEDALHLLEQHVEALLVEIRSYRGSTVVVLDGMERVLRGRSFLLVKICWNRPPVVNKEGADSSRIEDYLPALTGPNDVLQEVDFVDGKLLLYWGTRLGEMVFDVDRLMCIVRRGVLVGRDANDVRVYSDVLDGTTFTFLNPTREMDVLRDL